MNEGTVAEFAAEAAEREASLAPQRRIHLTPGTIFGIALAVVVGNLVTALIVGVIYMLARGQ